MAIKNAVTVKNSPNFLSTRTVTTNLTLMNSLTKKQVKQSKIATESKSGDVGCCEWTWRGSGIAIAIADVKQKTTIVFVQSFLQCSTTNPAGWGGASRSTASSQGGVGRGSCGSNFENLEQKSVNWNEKCVETICQVHVLWKLRRNLQAMYLYDG